MVRVDRPLRVTEAYRADRKPDAGFDDTQAVPEDEMEWRLGPGM